MAPPRWLQHELEFHSNLIMMEIIDPTSVVSSEDNSTTCSWCEGRCVRIEVVGNAPGVQYRRPPPPIAFQAGKRKSKNFVKQCGHTWWYYRQTNGESNLIEFLNVVSVTG